MATTRTKAATPPRKQTTKLAFEGKLKGVKTVLSGGGSLELTIAVTAPKRPARPGIPYEFADSAAGWGDGARWKPRPTAVAEAKKYDASRAKWDQEMVGHGNRLAAMSARMMSYAQIAGIAAIIGESPFSIVLTPSNQELFPGFGVELLPDDGDALLALDAGDDESDEEDGE